MKASPRSSTPGLVAGVDEAGRGPLAGPVVVAAVILDARRPLEGLADSKALSEAQRESLAPQIRACALAWSVIAVDVDEIERLNILGATMAGMTRALEMLSVAPDLALIDGNRLPKTLPCAARAIIGGDASEPAISAASILAKTERDRIMRELDPIHPGYGFVRHKGYSTPEHLAALERLGPCRAHRAGFAPVRRLLAPELF
ncbi:ribonuclease HII [Dokdonella soli]|uniref:Ribonuclease HII n=1 Tax=Dokdonella soli TaxID=529810 RepID=A0ABN1IWA5_9GAMM